MDRETVNGLLTKLEVEDPASIETDERAEGKLRLRLTKRGVPADLTDDEAAVVKELGYESNGTGATTAETPKKKKAKKAGKEAKPAKAPKAAKPAKPKKEKKAKAPKKPRGEKRMSLVAAAYKILRGSKKPMTCGEIVEKAKESGLWTSPSGKTPASTLNAAIGTEITKKGKASRFKKADRGLYEAVSHE